MFIKVIDLQFFLFSVMPLFSISKQCWSHTEFGRVSSCSIFWSSFNSVGVTSSVNTLQYVVMKQSDSCFSLDGRLDYCSNLIFLVVVMFRFSIYSCFNLNRLYQSRNLSIWKILLKDYSSFPSVHQVLCLLVIRKMKAETMTINYFSLTGMALIKKKKKRAKCR